MEEKHCDSLKNIFYTSKREEWRKWLSKNYRTAKEVAVLWARAMTAKNKFETREKVVYRKRHINKKVKNGTV